MLFNFILNKIAWDYNQRQINKILPLIKKINEFDTLWDWLYDDEIKAKTLEFKNRLSAWESLDDILPEAFAAIKQAAKRLKGKEFDVKWQTAVWDMVPYDVQLIWWIVLHKWKIAEMRTWEWKTLVATLPAYLNALTGKWVHIVTVNDYLASRDALWMANIFNFLWLTVGYVTKEVSLDKRRWEYWKDITYVENSELGFDYLRDNLAKTLDDRVLLWRPLNYAIVDEVDSILIDEARTPLIISHPSDEATNKYDYYSKIVRQLTPCSWKKKVSKWFLKELLSDEDDTNTEDGDYYVDEKLKTVSLSTQWIQKLEKILGVEHLYKDVWYEEIHHIENALKANVVYHNEKDYIIRSGEILIVDEHTGRTMPGRRYSEGLHQAIEAKEWVQIQRESRTLATITYQNFFKQYQKLSWMTGTGTTEWEEFEKIYWLEVLSIPTNKDVIRVDKTDKVFFNQQAKWKAVAENIKFSHEIGQPILIWTSSINTSEFVSNLLRDINVPHYVLNAKYHEQEAQIVANAWNYWSVVVATNMAWRWTDIKLENWLTRKLSENYAKWIQKMIKWDEFTSRKPMAVSAVVYSQLEFEYTVEWIKELFSITDEHVRLAEKWEWLKLEELWIEMKIKFNTSKKFANQAFAELFIKPFWVEEPEIVQKDFHYWLYILGTEKHESRRIDNQLRWRSWRQWDPGISQFFVALDDEIMRKIGWERIQSVAKMLLPKDELEKMELTQSQFTSSIERAQKQMEWWYFGIRKHLFEYDSVINKQRMRIYAKRDEILWFESLNSKNDNLENNQTLLNEQSNIIVEVKSFVDDILGEFVKTYTMTSPWNLNDLIESVSQISWFVFDKNDLHRFSNESDMKDYMVIKLTNYFESVISWVDTESLSRIFKEVYLQVLDKNWMSHIDDMQYLRENVWLYGYAQMDPLIIYKKQAFEKFTKLLFSIKEEILWILFRIDYNIVTNWGVIVENAWEVIPMQWVSDIKNTFPTPNTDKYSAWEVEIYEVWSWSSSDKKVRPNDLCTCWSGKKYKKCCGKDE